MDGSGIKKNRGMQQEKILGHNSEIGKKLKEFYSSIQEETIPTRFLDLLNALDQAEEAEQKSEATKGVDSDIDEELKK